MNTIQPHLYLLDRNAISLIKETNAGKVQTERKKIKFLSDLRSLDRAGSYFSAILSIIEGEHGKEDTAEEKAACQRKESESLRQFFKIARLDSDYLDSTSSTFAHIFTEHREAGWERRGLFCTAAAPLITHPVKREKRRGLESRLIAIAKDFKLEATEPTVVLALACVYGSEDARRVIKPAKFNAYNVLSDLQILSRINMIASIGTDWNCSLQFTFLSMDSGLNGVLKHIKVLERNMTEGTLNLRFQYSGGLFPGLTQAEHIDLLHRLIDANRPVE